MDKVRSFNTLYEELIDRLVLQFPEIHKLEEWGGMFQLMKRANVRGPMEYFMKHIVAFTDKILNEDVMFFRTNNGLREHASSIVSESGLDALWDNLDAESQANIWKYLKSLLKLGYSCYGIRGAKNISHHFGIMRDTENLNVLDYLKTQSS